MPKRLLIVDDEELFLESLKDGLSSLSHIFTTDVCYSVNEAIKCLIANQYDMVITDMRMPGKSGIELLIYLRDIKFPGKMMVMSAFNTEASTQQIRNFGVIEVISKPFNLVWFRDKIVEIFSVEDKDQKKLVTFESIDLVTVMQIINLERKTSALQIDIEDEKGIIYFERGEIISAEYLDLKDERAILKLIVDTQSKGSIAVKAIKEKVNKTILIPFVEHMMKIMKTIDELRKDNKIDREELPTNDEGDDGDEDDLKLMDTSDIEPSTPGKKTEGNRKKEIQMAINEKLSALKEVKGYLGAGVFTPQGEMLDGSADISGIQFEEAGSLIHDVLKDSGDMAREIGFGKLDMLQLYTQVGIVFAKCYFEGDIHFHTILVIKTDGNVAMARLKLNRVVQTLISEF
ncbi:MAG: response regulator [bacterium]|nr:response regulator [bacterium]